MKKLQTNFHESYTVLQEKVGIKQARSFGIVFAVFFLVIAFLPVIDWYSLKIWPVIMAAVCYFLARYATSMLLVPAKIWFKIGELLSKIVNPVVMGIIFYGVFTPIGFLMRTVGKAPLACKIDATSTSFWQEPNLAVFTPESFKRQF